MPPDAVDNIRKVKDIKFWLYIAILNKQISSQEAVFTATIYKTNLKLFTASV